MLIVEQLRGRWRVKDAKLAPLHAEAMARLGRFRRWSARHVPRSENRAADALANEALDRVAAGGPAVGDPAAGGGDPVRGGRAPAPTRDAGLRRSRRRTAPAPRTRAGAARDQLALGLEPGFDPGDPGPEAGELRVRILGSGTSTGAAPDRLRLRDVHLRGSRATGACGPRRSWPGAPAGSSSTAAPTSGPRPWPPTSTGSTPCS